MGKKVIDVNKNLLTNEFELPMDDGAVLMACADISYHVGGYTIPGTHDDPPESEWEVDGIDVHSVHVLFDDEDGYEPVLLSQSETCRVKDICRDLAEADFQG